MADDTGWQDDVARLVQWQQDQLKALLEWCEGQKDFQLAQAAWCEAMQNEMDRLKTIILSMGAATSMADQPTPSPPTPPS